VHRDKLADLNQILGELAGESQDQNNQRYNILNITDSYFNF